MSLYVVVAETEDGRYDATVVDVEPESGVSADRVAVFTAQDSDERGGFYSATMMFGRHVEFDGA